MHSRFLIDTNITVQELQENGKLKQIHKATGSDLEGDWRGTSVNREFGKMLEEIAGTESFEAYKKENVADWLTLKRNFEVKKREDIPESFITLKIPYSLLLTIKKNHPQEDTLNGNVQLRRDKTRIPSNKLESFFKKSVTNIKYLCMLMKRAAVKDVVAIIMVGGYSESKFLQDAIKGEFPKLKVIIPNEADLCVLKGAVIYGHKQTSNTERKCRMTFGFAVSGKCRPGVDIERIKNICFDVFKVFLKANVSLKIGAATSHTFKVGHEKATEIYLAVYASPETSPRYVTDENCQKLGTLKIEMSDTSRGADRGIRVQMIFGGTQIKVKATDIHTRKEHESRFKFVN